MDTVLTVVSLLAVPVAATIALIAAHRFRKREPVEVYSIAIRQAGVAGSFTVVRGYADPRWIMDVAVMDEAAEVAKRILESTDADYLMVNIQNLNEAQVLQPGTLLAGVLAKMPAGQAHVLMSQKGAG